MSKVRKGKHILPPRIVVTGEHGLGKSTFGSEAPNPIFIPTEDGLGNIDTSSFPLCESYEDVLNCIGALFEEDHDYETVVLDSVDWLEQLIWKHICKESDHNSIEDFGFGKGYVAALNPLREVLDGLNALRTEREMIVILTAHTQVKRFDDPNSESYDRYTMKLHAKASSVVSEWADVIGFVTQEMIVKKEDKGFNKTTSRAVSTGHNLLNLNRRPAFDAKNRYSMPNKIPLNWDKFWDALLKGRE